MMYYVYDSYGRLVRGDFSSYDLAFNYKVVYGNSNWKIRWA